MPEEPEGYINYVQRVYESRNNDELASNYDAWSNTYEQDTIENWGRLDPDVGAEIFAEHVPTDARILDAGAGTGIVGKLLSDKGYRKIAGIDLSEGMLQQARSKGVYQELRQMTLGERLDFPDDAFDAVVSICVFTQGHARPGSFDELIRVTRPGGKIVFGLRTDIYEKEVSRKNGRRWRPRAGGPWWNAPGTFSVFRGSRWTSTTTYGSTRFLDENTAEQYAISVAVRPTAYC